ncbi:MAG: hypothetical protein QOD66_3831 [Solirubrobacteraceae bacterium]|nr:hypothetical protein [Solirubrobacteraceae bacterium]
MAPQPWSAERLPPETVAAVRGDLGRLVDQIVAAIRAENPVYAEVLADPSGMGIRLGIEQALATFLDAVEHGAAPAGETDEVWRRLGEAEFQAGRSLDALRQAFRTGTRAAWRAAADVAAEMGVPTPAVITLAEGIFVYSDALAADVVEGYLRMQSDEAGERERRRRRLAALLLDAEAYDAEAVARAAELAGWSVPRRLAVLALAGDSAAPVTRRLDIDALTGADGAGPWLVVPDPDGPGRGAALRNAAEGIGAALGPSVAPAEAHLSLRWARRALELMAQRALPTGGLLRVSEHLPTMIVLGDEALARTLVRRALGPFDALGGVERERLLDTLQAWLAHQRHTPGIAAQLHVHPQTVRYRIARLRELLGDALDSPEGRFELELALRARGLPG